MSPSIVFLANLTDPELRRARIVRQRNLVLIAPRGWSRYGCRPDHLALGKSATEPETEVTPTVSVKVVKAEKGTSPPSHSSRHDLAARKG
jgi:hypothetical protein